MPTGPLTNVAAAVAADPGIVGSRGPAGRPRRDAPPRPGVTPYAERNVWCDPEAMAVVLAAGFGRLLMVGMDATFAVPFTADDAAVLAGRGSPAGTRVGALRHRADRAVPLRRRRWRRWPRRRCTTRWRSPACWIPGSSRPCRPGCVVETADPATYGATRFVLDAEDATVEVALGADHARYLALLLEAF